MFESDAERATALAEVAEAWRRYQALLDGLNDAALERPNTVGHWSGKDVVAHIANWEEHCIWLIEQWEGGRPKLWSYEFDVNDMPRWDIWNEEQLAPYTAAPVQEIRAYAARVHADLIQRVAASAVVTRQNLVAMTSGHYEFHGDDFARLDLLDRERSAEPGFAEPGLG